MKLLSQKLLEQTNYCSQEAMSKNPALQAACGCALEIQKVQEAIDFFKAETEKWHQNKDKFQKWKSEMQQVAHKAEFIIAKQRNGPVGSVELFFDAEFTRFGNLDIYHH